MAKAAWLKVTPASGSGNGSIAFSADAYTGRTARTTTATVSATGVDPKTVNVTQAAKAEFVTIQEAASAPKAGGTVEITGSSNSTKLTFTLGTGELAITLPEKYTANGSEATNDVAISGDPGASAQYEFSISITVPVNATVGPLTREVIVTDAGSHTATCLLTQAAGDPTLSLSTDTVNLTPAGTAVSVEVTSNTSWTVS